MIQFLSATIWLLRNKILSLFGARFGGPIAMFLPSQPRVHVRTSPKWTSEGINSITTPYPGCWLVTNEGLVAGIPGCQKKRCNNSGGDDCILGVQGGISKVSLIEAIFAPFQVHLLRIQPGLPGTHQDTCCRNPHPSNVHHEGNCRSPPPRKGKKFQFHRWKGTAGNESWRFGSDDFPLADGWFSGSMLILPGWFVSKIGRLEEQWNNKICVWVWKSMSCIFSTTLDNAVYNWTLYFQLFPRGLALRKGTWQTPFFVVTDSRNKNKWYMAMGQT